MAKSLDQYASEYRAALDDYFEKNLSYIPAEKRHEIVRFTARMFGLVGISLLLENPIRGYESGRILTDIADVLELVADKFKKANEQESEKS